MILRKLNFSVPWIMNSIMNYELPLSVSVRFCEPCMLNILYKVLNFIECCYLVFSFLLVCIRGAKLRNCWKVKYSLARLNCILIGISFPLQEDICTEKSKPYYDATWSEKLYKTKDLKLLNNLCSFYKRWVCFTKY